jgi:hypothetical protein
MKQKLFLFFSLALFILSFSHILFNLVQILPNKNFIDFFVYNGALEKFLNHQNPYNFLYGQPPDKVPFNYPPSALLILLPIKLFPLKMAQIMLVLLSFLAFWSAFWITLKMIKIRISLPHFLTLLAFFNQTFPVKFTLVLGQINLIVLGLAYGGLYLYKKYKIFAVSQLSEQVNNDRVLEFRGRGRSEWSPDGNRRGMRVDLIRKFLYFGSILFLSLASSLKIFPLFALPLFLILKDYVFVFWVLAIFITLNFLPGIGLFKQYYFDIIPSLNRAVGIPNFYDQSLLAFLLRLTHNPQLSKWLALGTIFCFYLYVLIQQNLRHKPLLFSFSFILALFSIGNLFSWQHHLVFAYPLIFILYLKFLGRSRPTPTKSLIFFFIWLILVFHFKTDSSPLLKNPFIASYQTIAVLFFIVSCLFSYSNVSTNSSNRSFAL